MASERNDGLGLSLSLQFSGDHNPKPPPSRSSAPAPFPMNLFTSPLPFMQNHISSGADEFQQSANEFGGIDVIEEVMVSSPNSSVSSLSGKREGEIDDEDAAARKKLRLSKEQALVLEETFKEHNTLNPRQKMALAKQLNLRPRQVEVWFQNRRARTKLKQTEVECEYMRRCCEILTEENRRLEKEMNELRALKLSPHLYRNMIPPTTLNMCPHCERQTPTAPPQILYLGLL
ncbi:Homeobox-leucine zipper protein ATHB-4 [Salvia divinorum]|uniref:Homeobox-leucine zipper protein ATHB-4 n=1 Tax=Salvia divinorum TaxID=28513 RepID=A0ABD1GWW3_SALDI